ncbi:MAG: fluoride efflux transporter CrcB [Planctomycetota bacterium]|nr:MAG: fluoride efflux transporter CrcB [Planctomycetota bacterium]
MLKIGLIFIGAGLGGVARYAIAGWTQPIAGDSFPIGTLVVNVIGCALIGFLGAAFAGPVLIREEYRVAILVGALGGFTTFSTFGRETFDLAADRQWLFAALNLVLSNGLGLAAVWLGTRVAGRYYGV